MNNTEVLKQKITNMKKRIGLLGGISLWVLIFLGACITKIPKILAIAIMIVFFILLVMIFVFSYRVKALTKLLKTLE